MWVFWDLLQAGEFITEAVAAVGTLRRSEKSSSQLKRSVEVDRRRVHLVRAGVVKIDARGGVVQPCGWVGVAEAQRLQQRVRLRV